VLQIAGADVGFGSTAAAVRDEAMSGGKRTHKVCMRQNSNAYGHAFRSFVLGWEQTNDRIL
jgi:hypothetical protein